MFDVPLTFTLLAQSTESAEKAGSGLGWILFIILIAIFAVPMFLGTAIGNLLKLKDLGFKIGIVFLTLTLGLAPFVYQSLFNEVNLRVATVSITVNAANDPPPSNDGYNTNEGTTLDVAAPGVLGKDSEVDNNGLSAVLVTKPTNGTLTLNADGSFRYTPNADFNGGDSYTYKIVRDGTWKDALRFGIDLAGGTNLVYQVDVEAAKAAGKDVSASMKQMVGAITRRVNPSGTKEVTVRQVGSDRIEIIVPGADEATVEEMKRQITRLGSLEFSILANEPDHRAIIAESQKLADDKRDYFDGKRVIARWHDISPTETLEPHGRIAMRTVKQGDQNIDQVLVVLSREKDRVTGKYLVKAYETNDEDLSLAVGFTFNSQGAFLFQTLTSRNRPLADGFKRRLAILLDGNVHSAPNLISTISRNGQITGNFERKEIEDLISVLNAGALEIPLHPAPISEFTISPTLGADVQDKGIFAIQIAAMCVLVFMVVYYWFAGLVADLCLMLNLILVMGTMSIIQATFTLPGLAGLVLTIGMAVDANVLIFERIREEKLRGSSLRMAIQNGFARAFTTIVDANVTTLIVAVVLFMIGTDQVKGFAVTLFIGIVMSMFSALFFGRLLFDIFERKRWIKDVPMASLVGSTSIDFVGKRAIAAVCSIALIVAGMASVVNRGQDNLDIDFRGGTMVTFEFVSGQKLGDVRADLEKSFGTSITLEHLTLSDDDQASDSGRRYRLRTTQEDVAAVRSLVAKTFANAQRDLIKITMTAGEITAIASATAEKSEDQAIAEIGFEGGHRVELKFSGEKSATSIGDLLEKSIAKLEKGYTELESLYQITGTEGSGINLGTHKVKKFATMTLLTRPTLTNADLAAALSSMETTMASSPNFEEVNKFAKSVGGEMQQAAILAMLISLVAIVAYIWFRFQRITFGLAAVAALVHDVLVVLGMVALASYASGSGFGKALMLYDFKINLPMIAAFLTIVGYSLNDTIVVFDRIREVRGKNPDLSDAMVNTSLNQTLARTLLTSITTFIVVAILYAVGGEGIHGFAFCLVLGVLVGTYSSIYVASPVLLWLMKAPKQATA